MAPSPPTPSQAKLIRNELLKDKNDLYNRYAWYIVVPGLIIYSLFALLNSHHAEPLENDVQGGEENTNSTLVLTVARDSLLRMTVTSEFPDWARNLHAYAGLLLVVGCLMQKQSAYSMATRKGYAVWKKYHQTAGFILIMLIGLMAVGGYAMGFHSALENFDSFLVLFVAPWVVWFFLLAASIQKKDYIATHRLLGNMVLKGCIAVPISRVAGAYLQRQDYGDANGYYLGILGTTILIGTWEIYEMYLFFTKK